MKILLMKVPEIDFEERPLNYTEVLSLDYPPIPLGIAALSAYLKKYTDHEIFLCDVFLEGFDSFKRENSRRVFLDILENKIREVKPDVLGISALMIINHKWVHHIAKVSKMINPNCKVIVGGGYATIMPDKLWSDNNVDFIVKGEGEKKLLDFLNSHIMSSGFIQDVDSLPFYDWEGIDLERYIKYHPKRFVSYVTSRGCPFGCVFCSTHLMWGKKFRPFSAKRVLDEIDYIMERYHAEEFEFSDDNLTLNKKRILDIMNGFIDRGYKFTWTHPNAVAVVTLDSEILSVMRKSGCEVLTIAPESGCERVLKNIIHKPIGKNKIREVVRIARELGFKIQGAWIIGFPGETKSEIDETRDFILELKLDRNQISIATPFIGTDMYSLCQRQGYLVETDNDFERYRYGFANIRTPEWDEKWLKQKQYDMNIEVNFLKNPVIETDPKYAVTMFEDILSRYPKHIVASQCLARAYKKMGQGIKANSIINGIGDLINREPEIYNIYRKYMDNVAA